MKRNIILFSIVLFTFCFAKAALANVPDSIDIFGMFRVAVGTSNNTFTVSFNCSGDVTSNVFLIRDLCGNELMSTNVYNQLTISYIGEPVVLVAYARVDYIYPTGRICHLEKEKYIYYKDIILSSQRRGIDRMYTGDEETVPIHWNFDDDNKNGTPDHDDVQMNKNDNDLLSIKIWIRESDIYIGPGKLEIITSGGYKLWGDTRKNNYYPQHFIIQNCDLQTWLEEYADGYHMFMERHGDLYYSSPTGSLKVRFNGRELLDLQYHAYAVLAANKPTLTDRAIFANLGCNFDGCEWGIFREDVATNFNSVAWAVDPTWEAYGTPFVVTPCEPLCPDIYTLSNCFYEGVLLKCTSLDTFGNSNGFFNFGIDDIAFYQSPIWSENFLLNNNVSDFGADIIEYASALAARKAPPDQRWGCYPSWSMVNTFFFGRPKILYRAQQINSPILSRFVLAPDPTPDPE